MKKLLLFLTVFFTTFSFAQVSPTLAVGLETLTMNKGTIDVKVLTEIIVSKQKELKQEALKRFMYKLFPEANYTTKFYVQNCLNVLLNEKNPQVIEKEILELTTNYALALGVTYALVKSNDDVFKRLDSTYESYKYYSSYYQEKVIQQISNDKEYSKEIESLKKEINDNETAIVTALKNPKEDSSYKKELISKKENLDGKKRKLSKLILKNNLKNQKSVISSTSKEHVINMISDLKLLYKNNPKVDSDLTQIKNYLEELDKLYKESSIKTEAINTKFKLVFDLIEKIKGYEETNASLVTKLNGLKNKFVDFKPSVPFGIILDVVSLSLSDIKELKDKGFFKNKIDYRNDSFYQNLDPVSAKDFKEELDKLKVFIEKKITLYAKNYDVIKEFIQKNNTISTVKIKEELLDTSIDEAITFIQSKSNNINWLKSLYDTDNKELNKSIDKVILNQIKIEEIASLNEKVSSIKSVLKNELTNDGINESINKVNAIIADLKKTNSKDIVQFNISSLQNTLTSIKLQDLALPTTSIDSIENLVEKSVSDINTHIKEIKSLDDIQSIQSQIKELKKIIPQDNIYNQNLDNAIASFDKTITSLEAFNNQLIVFKNDLEKNTKKFTEDNNSEFSKIIRKSKTFSSTYLNTELNEILNHIIEPNNLVNGKNIGFNTEKLDSVTIAKASVILPEVFDRIKKLVNNQNIKLQDILYLEDYVTSKMIELKIRDNNNDAIYNTIINDLKKVIPLFKLKIIENVDDIGEYNEELLTLFEFIGNLNKLDKAETYQSIIDMLREGSQKVEDNLTDGSFKDQYILFVNAIKKYTIINPNADKEYIEVDVVSFLNDLQQYYNRNNRSNFGLYLTLGLNQNFFFNDFTFPDSGEIINNIGFASEKIGLKYRFLNFKNYNGYENIIKDDVYLNKKAPFVNEFYGILYGSGLLYSLANTANNQNFDFAHVGVGVGIRFYNALDVNAIIGFPFVKNEAFGSNPFFGFGLDIPLGEYLEKLGSKK